VGQAVEFYDDSFASITCGYVLTCGVLNCVQQRPTHSLRCRFAQLLGRSQVLSDLIK
jgi:hypothetical protein